MIIYKQMSNDFHNVYKLNESKVASSKTQFIYLSKEMQQSVK